MLEKFLFEIPAALKADILAGNVERFGTILKHVDSGKIVGHIQETSLLSDVFSSAVNPINMLSNPISAVSSVAANFQLAKLTKMVEMLQMMGVANLGVSLVGVGVSAAGFIILKKQLNQIQSNINLQTEMIHRQFKSIKFDRLRDQFTKIDSYMQELEHNRHLKSSGHIRIANLDLQKDLNRAAAFFINELSHMLETKQLDERLFCELLRAYNLSSSAQMECLLNINEMETAQKTVETHNHELDRLLNQIDPVEFTEIKLMNLENKPADYYDYELALNQTQQLFKSFRNTQQMSKSKILLLQELESQKITGPQYLSEIHNSEPDQVLKLLPI